MAIILAAPLMTVATFILRKGSVKAAKKYGPKLIKKAKDYIKKNKLILSGNKVIKPPKKSIKTVRKVNKKPTKKKDSFDEQLKKKEGAAKFNKLNKTVQTKNPKLKTKNKSSTTKNTTKNNKNTTKNKEDKPIKENIQTKDQLKKNLNTKKKITGGAVIAGGIGLSLYNPFKSGGGKKSGTEPSTFGAAFRKARKEKGPNSTFIYKGKVYSTVTEDQYKKAGFNSLREYLNAQKKK
jgi:hypothetical protein|tara:strand:+ start:1840 stop:2547 length:708 start_codon:yes stop_codon:yes gene_type:complete